MRCLATTHLLLCLVSVYSLCEPWCTEPCTELNGYLEQECGSCPQDGPGCHPGAAGFHRQLRGEAHDSAAPEARPVSEDPVPRADPLALQNLGEQARLLAKRHKAGARQDAAQLCAHVSAEEVLALDDEQRAQLFSQPTLIKGMLDNWPLRAEEFLGHDASSLNSILEVAASEHEALEATARRRLNMDDERKVMNEMLDVYAAPRRGCVGSRYAGAYAHPTSYTISRQASHNALPSVGARLPAARSRRLPSLCAPRALGF